MNLSDLFSIPLDRDPERVAIEFRDASGSAALSYAELHGKAARFAAVLAQQGVSRGDRVAFFLGNRPEFAVAYLAVLRLGAVMVPINLAYRQREIAHILGDAEPRALITETAQRAVLEELDAKEYPVLERVLFVESLAVEMTAEEAPAVAVDGGELALIMYTSGTTGRSKGAMLTHDNVLATVSGLLAAWGWSRADSILVTLPLFHTHGLVVAMHCALAAGATIHLRRRFDARAVVEELGSGSCSLFFGVPTMYVRLVDELRACGAAESLRALRLFCSGSAPLSPETWSAFRDLTGHSILERYGMTETGMLISNAYARSGSTDGRVPGTVGVPLPGVSARIVDTSGDDVTPGAEGELWVAGSNVFDGYWRAPEKTAESFAMDSAGRRWFRTGDLARRDLASGHYVLLGRRHELIIAGGFNVYPREIEEVLETYPGIREAAVVGRPHPEWGEVPFAFVVADGELPEGEVIAWCKTQLASFKAPHGVRVVEALPRNALGKVQKHLLPKDL
ncbi:MAG: AMP-binding protein [Acidobacteriota bacterium]